MNAKLTKAQQELLCRLTTGEHITHSQDGECAWLWPSRDRLDHVTPREFQQLRDLRLIGADPSYDYDEAVRFGPSEVITPAGRAALNSEPSR